MTELIIYLLGVISGIAGTIFVEAMYDLERLKKEWGKKVKP